MPLPDQQNRVDLVRVAVVLGAWVFAIAVTLVADYVYFQRPSFEDSWPHFTTADIVRSLLLGGFIFMTVWLVMAGHSKRCVLDQEDGPPLEKAGILAGLCFHTAFVLLFLVKPSLFSLLSEEDRAIEWGSAVLYLGCSTLLAHSLWRSLRLQSIGWATRSTLAGFSFVFFVMAMEEVSWMQRVFDYQSSEIFMDTGQKETNLHNFDTDLSETIYYFGAFVCLVVIPLSYFIAPRLTERRYFGVFIPRLSIAILGAFACVYNFDMWDAVLTQFTFYVSMSILFFLSIRCQRPYDRGLLVACLISAVLGQAIYLSRGPSYARLWEITEYKEFFIPLAFFIYCIDVARRVIPRPVS